MPKLGRMCSPYLREGHLIQISFALSYCHHVTVRTSHNALVYIKSHLQPSRQKLAHREQVGLQFRHVEHVGDSNRICFASRFNSNDNGPHSDGFGQATIAQTHIAWRDYLVGVECRLMRSHVLCGSRIHDPFANAPRMRFEFCCKCEFVLDLRIVGTFLLLVLCFVAKPCNMTRFAAIETRPHTLPQTWIAPFALTRHQCHFFALGLLLLAL